MRGIEYDQDHVSAKSRTGYVMIFTRCPILWASTLLTQIVLSTMEAECMTKEVLKEISTQIQSLTLQIYLAVFLRLFCCIQR